MYAIKAKMYKELNGKKYYPGYESWWTGGKFGFGSVEKRLIFDNINTVASAARNACVWMNPFYSDEDGKPIRRNQYDLEIVEV